MATPRQIIDTLGRAEVVAQLGVSPQSMTDALRDGRFPARWFAVISAMCAKAGVPCEQGWFAFIKVNRQPIVSAQAEGKSR